MNDHIPPEIINDVELTEAEIDDITDLYWDNKVRCPFETNARICKKYGRKKFLKYKQILDAEMWNQAIEQGLIKE